MKWWPMPIARLAKNHSYLRVYEAYLAELSDTTERELMGELGGPILYFDSAAAGERHLEQATSGVLRSYLARGMGNVKMRQALIDSPEEYFRLDAFRARCPPRI